MQMHPRIVPRIAIGVARITAIGSVQLSYWAASTRMVIMIANMNTNVMVVPD